jgi:CubicO group peptidase (beta-lactamase class C family)
MVVTTMSRPAEQQERAAPGIDELGVRSWVDALLNRRAAVGMAVGVVREGGLVAFQGRGLADVASRTPVTEDTVFRIASITKTFTAIAAMQLHERGLVDLDAPANDYLRAYRLVPAKPWFRPATVRHLMTHTAGLAEVVPPLGLVRPDWGESVTAGRPLPSLAEYYRGELRIAAEPGTRFVYGDHSPATLGQLVEDVSGEPLDRYFREHIFEPLGMAGSDLVPSDRVRSRLATGYSLGASGPKAVPDREFVTAAAASIRSTPRDMARYLAALLGGGANEHGAVLKPATLATMFAPQFQPDPRLPGMGLGFFRADLGGRPVVEHRGILPGFNSQIIVAPGEGVGVMAFTNGAKDATMWLFAESCGLLRRLIGVPDDAIRTDVPQHPELWPDICGWYQLDAGLTDIRLRATMGAGAEVFVRGDRPMLRFLTPIPQMYGGFPLHPDDEDDPDAFRMDFSEFGMGTQRVMFNRDPGAGATSLNLEMMPVSLRRRPARTNPRLWATGALGALGATTAAIAIRQLRR